MLKGISNLRTCIIVIFIIAFPCLRLRCTENFPIQTTHETVMFQVANNLFFATFYSTSRAAFILILQYPSLPYPPTTIPDNEDALFDLRRPLSKCVRAMVVVEIPMLLVVKVRRIVVVLALALSHL